MTLIVTFKNGTGVQIDKFSKVNYLTPTGIKTVESDNLSNLVIKENTSYHFEGDSQIVVMGSEIRYLQFN